MEQLFTDIYNRNTWGSAESRSGHGSNLQNTVALRAALPTIVAGLGVRTLLDIPCGDFWWMKEVRLRGVTYTGADIVKPLIKTNHDLYSSDARRFINLDITQDDLPRADLIVCRDCLVHFSDEDVWRALANLKRSGSKYLLTTTFTARAQNRDIETGLWRPLNLQIAPFNFPPPLRAEA
jgi:2-polyprenyl-3-methyl-5-hydroxy-6-metoxy-1,4-benzoquinol methylase